MKELINTLNEIKKLTASIFKPNKAKLKNFDSAKKYQTITSPILEKLKSGMKPESIDINLKFESKKNGYLDFSMNDKGKISILNINSKNIDQLKMLDIKLLRLHGSLLKEHCAVLKSAIAILYQITGYHILSYSKIPDSLSLYKLHRSLIIHLRKNRDVLKYHEEYEQILAHLELAVLLYIFYERTSYLDTENMEFVDFIQSNKTYKNVNFSELLETHKHPEGSDFSYILLDAIKNHNIQDISNLFNQVPKDQFNEFRIYTYMEAIFQLDQAIHIMIETSVLTKPKPKKILCEDHPLLNNRFLLRKLYGKELNQMGNTKKSQIYKDYRTFLRNHFITDEHKHKYKSKYEAVHQLSQQYAEPLDQYMKRHMQEHSHSTSLSLDELPEYLTKFINDDTELKNHLIKQIIEK